MIGLGIGLGLSTAGVPWTPAKLSPLAWFAADLGANSSGTWKDQSTHAADAVQATTANKPIFHSSGGPNNLPYYEFPSSNDRFMVASGTPTPTKPCEILCALQLGSQANYMAPVDLGPGNSGLWVNANDANICTSNGQTGTACSVATDFVADAIINAGSSTTAINGGSTTASTESATLDGGITLGAYAASPPTYGLFGRIYEVILVESLSSADRALVVSYLKAKWAIA